MWGQPAIGSSGSTEAPDHHPQGKSFEPCSAPLLPLSRTIPLAIQIDAMYPNTRPSGMNAPSPPSSVEQKGEMKKVSKVEDASPLTSAETDTGSVFVSEETEKNVRELDSIHYDPRRNSWTDSHPSIMVDQVFQEKSVDAAESDANTWKEQNFDFGFKRHSISNDMINFNAAPMPAVNTASRSLGPASPHRTISSGSLNEASSTSDLSYRFERMNIDYNTNPLGVLPSPSYSPAKVVRLEPLSPSLTSLSRRGRPLPELAQGSTPCRSPPTVSEAGGCPSSQDLRLRSCPWGNRRST